MNRVSRFLYYHFPLYRKLRGSVMGKIDEFVVSRCDHNFKEYRQLSGPDMMHLVRCEKCKHVISWGFLGLASKEDEDELRRKKAEQGGSYWTTYGDYHERPRTGANDAPTRPGSAHNREAQRWLDDIIL